MPFISPGNILPIAFLLAAAWSPFTVADGAGPADRDRTEQAILEFRDGNRDEAIRSMMQLAYQGNVAAQFNLGVINYAEGDSEVARKESIYWFTQAAEEGDLGAQFNLGMLMLEVPGSASRQQAVAWLQRAAESGQLQAMVNLGILGIADSGIPGGVSAGREWLDQAARAGDATAAALAVGSQGQLSAGAMLGRMYPIDRELRSQVNRGGSRITQDGTPVYPLPTGRQDALVSLPLGATVEVIEKRDGWVKVRSSSGLPAWISAAMVDIQGRRATVNRLEAPLMVQPRNDPSVYRIGTVNRGEQMPILGRDADWVQVEAPPRFTGWIREGNVDLRVRTVRSGIGSDGGPVARMRNLPASTAAVSGGAGTSAATVLADTAVYLDPDIEGRVIGMVTKGSVIDAAPPNGEFTRVVDAHLAGWIYGDIVRRNGDDVEVRVDRARIRAMPGTDSAIIELAEAGEVFTVDAEEAGWFRIRLNEESGWVRTAMLAPGAAGSNQAQTGAVSLTAMISDETPSSAPRDAVLYRGSEKNAEPLGRLMADSPLSAADPGQARIRVDGPAPIYGWIFSTLVEYSGDAGTVIRNGARIRLDPDTTEFNIVGVRSQGDKVRVIGEADNWLRIELEPASGWVDARQTGR